MALYSLLFHRTIPALLLACFAYLTAQPKLEFVEAFSSAGMESLIGLAVSNDGKNVYSVSGHTSMGDYNAVNAYARDSVAGKLSLIRSITYVAGLNELDNARAIAISPDDKSIYVAAHDNNKLNRFRRDNSTGDITYQGSLTAQGLKYGYAIAVSPDNKNVYVVSSAIDVDNTIVVFARDTSSGALTFLEVHTDGANGIAGMRRVNDCVVSPDGGNVYSVGGGAGLVTFSRDKTTGKLTYLDSIARPGYDCTISPDGKNIYVTGTTNSIYAYARNEQSGKLTYLSTRTDGQNGIDGLNNPSDIAVGPDGKAVFTSASKDSAVSFFSRNSATGDLTYKGMVQDSLAGTSGLAWPIDMKISPDGKFLYAAASYSKSIVCFKIVGASVSVQRTHAAPGGARRSLRQSSIVFIDPQPNSLPLYDLLGRSVRSPIRTSGIRVTIFFSQGRE